jgi:hypothetical protein
MQAELKNFFFLVSSFFFLPPKNEEDWFETYSPWSFVVARFNHNKMKKRSEKIILWRRHHLRLDVAVPK